MTATRSPSTAASVKSCVTSSAGHAAVAQDAASSREALARVRASSAESGSSSSSARGSGASARARATRWRSPPESVARPRVGEGVDAEALEQLDGAAAAVGALAPAQPVGDVLPDGHVAEQRVVLEDVAAAALLGRELAAGGRVEPDLVAAGDAAVGGAQQSGGDPQQRALAGAGRAGQREAGAGRRLEDRVEREARRSPRPPAERGAGLNAQHAAPPSPAPPSSFADSSSVPDTMTSTADSASAASKSVPRRS